MKVALHVAAIMMATTSVVVAQGAAQSPAATESKTIAGKNVSITYNSPRVNGREGKLFGKDGRIAQDPNYPIWRAGANAATKLHTDANLKVGDINVPKGDYTLFVDISNPDAWVLVINKQTGQWGLKYDKSQDLGRTPMQMSKPPSPIEQLKYELTDDGQHKGTLKLEWEDHIASVPIIVQ